MSNSNFTPLAAAFNFYFGLHCTDVVSAWAKKCCCRFLSSPSPPLPEPAEAVTASAAADPVDFKAMAAEQNGYTEMQRLLSGSSIQLAFCPAGALCLAGDVTTGVFFTPVSSRNSENTFFPFSLHFTSQESHFPAYGIF